MHLPVVNMFGHTEKYLRLLFCTTFPFTTSLREKILEGDPEVRPRVCGVDFREYGGRCKAIWTGKDPDHYRNTMKKNNDILSHYSANLKPAEIGSYFEGFTVMAHSGGKGVFVVRNGSRHTVPDLDTFNAMKLKHDEILYVSDDIFRTIPVGASLPSLSA